MSSISIPTIQIEPKVQEGANQKSYCFLINGSLIKDPKTEKAIELAEAQESATSYFLEIQIGDRSVKVLDSDYNDQISGYLENAGLCSDLQDSRQLELFTRFAKSTRVCSDATSNQAKERGDLLTSIFIQASNLTENVVSKLVPTKRPLTPSLEKIEENVEREAEIEGEYTQLSIEEKARTVSYDKIRRINADDEKISDRPKYNLRETTLIQNFAKKLNIRWVI